MLRILINITIFFVALASCKDESPSRPSDSDNELAGFKVGVSKPQRVLPRSRPDWLAPVPPCPADVLPDQFVESNYDLDSCAGAAVSRCLNECQGNNASSCYASAIILQRSELAEERSIATALFSRACQLGVASGCTNWGATLDEELDADCLRRSFEAACKRGHDPWGCTMYARALVFESEGNVAIETIQALSADACRLGENDPACEDMKTIIRSLQESAAVRFK